jgi:hypothetical protein
MVLIEAAAAFWLATLNVLLLTSVALAAHGRPRRFAAGSLACVCAGLALEALLFLGYGDTAVSGWQGPALVTVRTALMASMGLISLLLVRALTLRRW